MPKMSPLPKKPWDELSMDFFGPLPSGDYIMVVIDDYTRYPVIEILTSITANAIVPRLDRIFAMFGIPSICRTDNGPPFNGQDFADFAESMVFKHRKVTPLHPEANGHAEKFMQPLKKAIQTAHAEGSNFKNEINKFIRNYVATPHFTTGVSPAEMMFSRKIKTKLPEFAPKLKLPDKFEGKRDEIKKQQNKVYADKKRGAKPSEIKVGDKVLIKQRKRNKLSTNFNPTPATVITKNKAMITVKHNDKIITRDASHYKPLQNSKGGEEVK